jgi:predicted metal-dependent phosphoesterase TrpH
LDFKQSGRIDLHIHSTASDGTHTPQEIMAMADQLGLKAIAITDHDTLDGCRQAFNGDIPSSLGFITGVEISVQAPEDCNIRESLHILGYGINPEDPALLQALDKFQNIRNTRVHQIVQRLNQLGIPLELKQAMAESKNGAVGRPHVATAMVKAGYAKDINDAFDRYLGNGQPACIGKKRMACSRAFELIRGAGGIPVLAHPYLIPCKGSHQLDQLVKKLSDMDLKGIEIYYPRHTPDAMAQYMALARKYGLLATGGTDYHGELIPEIKMGAGTGNFYVPYEIFEKLISAHPSNFVR